MRLKLVESYMGDYRYTLGKTFELKFIFIQAEPGPTANHTFSYVRISSVLEWVVNT